MNTVAEIEVIRKNWLSPLNVYNEYGLSVSTLAKWRMKNKNLPFSKIGKYVKYRRIDIENFLEAHVISIDEVA